MAKSEITVEGFVAVQPESRTAGRGTVTSVKIPVEQGRRKDGQWVADTDKDGNKIVVWWEAEFWDEHGDVVAANIGKGDLVTVRGEARPQAFLKKDGGVGLRATVANAQIAKIVRRPSRVTQQGSGGGWQSGAGAVSSGGGNAPQNADPGFGGGFDDDQPF